MSQRRKQIIFLIPRNTVTQTLKFQIFMISLTVRLILSEMTNHYTINQSTVPTLFIMHKCILYHLPTLQTNYIICSFCLFFSYYFVLVISVLHRMETYCFTSNSLLLIQSCPGQNCFVLKRSAFILCMYIRTWRSVACVCILHVKFK